MSLLTFIMCCCCSLCFSVFELAELSLESMDALSENAESLSGLSILPPLACTIPLACREDAHIIPPANEGMLVLRSSAWLGAWPGKREKKVEQSHHVSHGGENESP